MGNIVVLCSLGSHGDFGSLQVAAGEASVAAGDGLDGDRDLPGKGMGQQVKGKCTSPVLDAEACVKAYTPLGAATVS